jgi:hypothetical protein
MSCGKMEHLEAVSGAHHHLWFAPQLSLNSTEFTASSVCGCHVERYGSKGMECG